MRTNYKLLFLILLFIMISTGCSKTTFQNQKAQFPSHISKTLATNLEVDADVIAPDKSTLPTYKTKIFEPSKEQVQEAFFSEIPADELTLKRRTLEEDDEYGFGIYYKKEKSFNYFGYQLFMNYKYTNHFDTISCYPDPLYDLPYDFTAAGVKGTQNLSFLSKEDALSLFKQTATTLGLILDDAPLTCIGLTANDLNTLYEYSGLIHSDNNVSFSEGEECYYILWNTKAEMGEQIYNETYNAKALSKIQDSSGHYILGIVGKDGVVTLETKGIYKTIEKDTDEQIISANTALESVKKKYQNNTLNTPITITKIEFVYSNSLIDKTFLIYEFLPTWSILSYDVSTDSYSTTNVNAITGELLP